MSEPGREAVGQQLGKYRLTRLLGSGGFAHVYLAEHLYLETQAAIKVLHTKLSGEREDLFRQEARIVARLAHPHIVRVFDFDVEKMTPFLVMDYAPGGALRQRHPKGSRVPLTTIVSYIRQIASALQYAHEQKLIHRDIKPENMLLDKRGNILLSDFGEAAISHSTASQLVVELAGTIAYIAPEQLQGLPRPASDQYSLAIVVYEWLSGERPFQGTFAEIASQHILKPPPPLCARFPDIPPAVEHVLFKALAKEPHERFTTIQEFASALELACQGQHTSFSTISAAPATHASEPPTIPLSPAASFMAASTLPPARLPSSSGQTSSSHTPSSSSAPPTIVEVSPQHSAPTFKSSSERSATPIQTPRREKRPGRRSIVIVPLLLLLISGSVLYAFYSPSTVNNLRSIVQGMAGPIFKPAQTQSATATAQAATTATVGAPETATALASTPQGLYTLITSRPPSVTDSLSAQSANVWDGGPNCTFESGKYILSAPPSSILICYAHSTNFCNLAYQVQMNVLSGDGGGIVFRSSNTNQYRFRANPDGTYDIVNANYPMGRGSSAAIKQGLNVINVLTAIARGNQINLYVNGQLITSLTDNVASCGQIGLMALGAANNTSVAYSNVKIWTL